MRKILVISHSSVLEINRRLYEGLGKSSDTQVGLICPSKWEDKSLKRKYEFEGKSSDNLKIYPLTTFFTGNGSLFLYRFSDLKKVREEFKPDIIFLDEEPWALVTWQVFRVFKGVTTFIYTKQNLIKDYTWPFRNIEQSSYDHAESFFAISKEAWQVLEKKGCRKPVEILPHAFDSQVFFPRETHEYPKKTFVIGYVGRLVPEKGVQDLLRAFRMLRKPDNIEVRIRIIGSGQADNELKELSKRLKIDPFVDFVGAVGHGQVGQEYRKLDLLAAPSQTTESWKEQFGRMLIEAAASGVPVIGSDSGEIPNVIESLQNGLVFKEKDHEDLCHQIENIIHYPKKWQSFRENGLKNVNSTYSYPGITNTVLNVIDL